MNKDNKNSMESFLRKENLKLMLENIELRSRLSCKEIVDYEELERDYKDYYSESNEVMKSEESIFR